MRETNIPVIVLGSKATALVQNHDKLFSEPERVLSMLGNRTDTRKNTFNSVFIKRVKTVARKKRAVPPFPDWDQLDPASQTHAGAEKDWTRYGARLCFLAGDNQKKVNKGLKSVLRSDSNGLFVVADLTDCFSSGILWDCVHMARTCKKDSGELHVTGFLGIGASGKVLGSQTRAQAYAALKEMHYLASRDEYNLTYDSPVFDRVVFFDLECFNSVSYARLFASFLAGANNQGFLGPWVADIEKKEKAGLFTMSYPPVKPAGKGQNTHIPQENLCAFSAFFPYHVDPAPLSEAFVLRLARDVASALSDTDDVQQPEPLEILQSLSFSREIILEWVTAQMVELSDIGSSEQPLSMDEFVNVCLTRQQRFISRTTRRFEDLLSRNDLPGRMGEAVQNTLNHYSLSAVTELIHGMKDMLEGWASDVSSVLYKSREGNKSLDTFIAEMLHEQNRGEKMLSDHLAGDFLPAYTMGLEHNEIKRLLSKETADQQRSFLRHRLEFLASSQSLIYLYCALEDLKEFIMEAMNVREAILQKSIASLDSTLHEARTALKDDGVDASTFHETYRAWLEALGEKQVPHILAEIIRTEGMPTESSGALHIRHLERWYPGDFEKALVSFLKEWLVGLGPTHNRTVMRTWVGKCLVPRMISDQNSMLALPDDIRQLNISVFLCMHKGLGQKTDFRAISGTGGTLERMSTKECSIPAVYRFVHGFPLSFLKGIKSWFFDYEEAISQSQPVHVIKSIVYTEEPFDEPPSRVMGSVEAIFLLALAARIIQERKGEIGYPGRRKCFWNIFWDKARSRPIWMSHGEFIVSLKKHAVLQGELSDLIIDHLSAEVIENKLSSREAADKLLKNEHLQDSIAQEPSMERDVIQTLDAIYDALDSLIGKTK